MNIILKGLHKSLHDLQSADLPDFTVITGKNGSGKSQLIELFSLKASNQLPPLIKFDISGGANSIQVGGIESPVLSILNNSSWTNKVDVYLNEVKPCLMNTRKLAFSLLSKNTWTNELLDRYSITKSINDDSQEFKELITKACKEIDPPFFSSKERSFERIEKRLLESGFLDNKKKSFIVAKFVADYRGKTIEELLDADFYLTGYPEYFLESPKLFGSQLEFIFYNYAKRRDTNRKAFFYKNEEGEKNDSISDKKFIIQYPPPWESINEILEKNGIDFKFKGIDKSSFSSDSNISFELIKQSIQTNVEFQNLSSGEKVIIGLIIKLFTSQYYSENLEFPDLIVLDEPDAHLHPEMSKLLIDVLKGTFVTKLQIKVIMTTHSPSTIALCPEDSIFQLVNHPVCSLERINKDSALEILTGFLPTLSIDYQNHKQVFVESPTDVKYYQTIFNKLYEERKYPFRLYFISSSLGKGNCDLVLRTVESIRSAGNRTAFGVIDWDLTNRKKEYVKVHGEGARYNIENFLYDPIYMVVLFMTMTAHNIYDELGLDKTFNQYTIGEQAEPLLQNAIDWFFTTYHKVFPSTAEIESFTVNYLNGKSLRLPKWFLHFKGHDYEVRLKKAFPALEKFTGEGQLQEEMTIIIGKCFPFIPVESVDVIESIVSSKSNI